MKTFTFIFHIHFLQEQGYYTTTHRNVVALWRTHIRDHGLELYQRLCNIPGLRRKNFTRIFPSKKSKSKIVYERMKNLC